MSNWIGLTLLSAWALASADALTKAWLSHYSAWSLMLIRFTVTGLILAPWLLYHLPNLSQLPMLFWCWVLLLLPLEIMAMLFYMHAIRDYPLSLTVPYLALTPVFVICIAFVLLDEHLSWLGIAGIMTAVVGTWLLDARFSMTKLLHWPQTRGSQLMVLVAFIYALTATLGKVALQYITPILFGALYFMLLGITAACLTLVLWLVDYWRYPSDHMKQFRHLLAIRDLWRRPVPVFGVALLNAVMVQTHFMALQHAEVAYMIAIKRTSLLFGIGYGWLIFREAHIRQRLGAGVVIILGVVLIAYSDSI
jgi:drug/metabolite transporter (DMT)-like permease